MVKKQFIELPDKQLFGKRPYIHDTVKIFVRKTKVEFVVYIDGAGNEFKIDKKELMELLK